MKRVTITGAAGLLGPTVVEFFYPRSKTPQGHSLLSNTRAKEALGWKPVRFWRDTVKG
ncbi:MAG: hypothetical protein LBD78_11545 [Spirochaetaceae bacterium]|jgi:nucleoside-diphosphate-sugar epimerase|nr:hypothetical protein [Spirochaetaceae bacterium]